MSFFHKKMSQNLWATIMPFGPVTLIFYGTGSFRPESCSPPESFRPYSRSSRVVSPLFPFAPGRFVLIC